MCIRIICIWDKVWINKSVTVKSIEFSVVALCGYQNYLDNINIFLEINKEVVED